MPYNNEYNRQVASDVNRNNWRYSTLYAYSPVDGRGSAYAMDGGSNAGVLFQMGNASKRDANNNIVNDNVANELPPVYYYGNSAEEMSGGNGFAEGTYRDRGDGSQLGVEPASGVYNKGAGMSGGDYSEGCGMSGGNIFSDIYHGFEDLGSDIGSAVEYLNPFGSGKPDNKKARLLGRMLGKMMRKAHELKGAGMNDMMESINKAGAGMSGGSWWSALKDGISDVVSFIPDLVIHGLGKKKAGRPKKIGKGCGCGDMNCKGCGMSGGAILGNPDPYPVQGNSQRIAGRGRGRPKKVGGALVDSKQDSLLAMPSIVLANGVPPEAQLRGSYGGAKPKKEKKSKVEEKVLKAVAKKLKGGKNLSGMTDKRAEMKEGIVAKAGAGMSGGNKRSDIVKKVMKEKGMKMIEASKYVKQHNLYKKA